jgi:small subunit ribosomal protein S23
MVRKIPTQVPATVSRLIESSLIKTPPPWYNAVLANPPPVLPARQVTARSRPGAKGYSDLPASYAPGASAAAHSDPGVAHHKTKFLRQPKIRPAPIVYAADRVRRQFFSDFPFEALRPVSLVEAARVAPEHAVKGAQWTALEQRGAYPTVEDTVAFTLALHEQGVPLSAAYARATDEFVALRAQHEVATLAAAAEARALGAEFKRDDWVSLNEVELLDKVEDWERMM